MLDRHGIYHRLKEALNDIATIDSATRTVKDMLARRIGELGDDWLTHLEPTISAYNKLDHSALHNNAPKEVMGDDDLRFRLRMENADNHIDNIKQSQTRKQKLEVKGGFRTLNQPLSFKRRTGIPNWSTEVH